MSYQVNYLLQQRQKSFINDRGESVPYTETVMSGYVAGELIEINLKLTQADRKLVRLLLNAAEDVNVSTASAAEQILPERFTTPVNGKLDLHEEEEQTKGFLDDEA